MKAEFVKIVTIDKVDFKIGDIIEVKYLWETLNLSTRESLEYKKFKGKILDIHENYMIVDCSKDMESNMKEIYYSEIEKIDKK